MGDEAEGEGGARIERHRLAAELHALALAAIGLQLGAEHVAEGGARPARRVEEVVGVGERHQARLDALEGGVGIRGRAERLRDDRLDRGERVLDAVVELVEEEALALLGLLALGRVHDDAEGAHRPSAGVEEDAALEEGPARRRVAGAGEGYLDAHPPVALAGLGKGELEALPVLMGHQRLEAGGIGGQRRIEPPELVIFGRPAVLVAEEVAVPAAEPVGGDGEAVALLAEPERFFHAAAGIDVAERADAAKRLAGGAEIDAPGGHYPALGPVIGAADAEFGLVGRVVGGGIGAGIEGKHALGVIGVDEGGEDLLVGPGLRRQAEDGEELGRQLAGAARRIDVPDADAGGGDGKPQALLAGADLRRILGAGFGRLEPA